MASYIVVFELKNAATSVPFTEKLKGFTGYCPLTDRSWAITANESAKEVRDQLMAVMGPADRLFVFRSGTEAAWRNSYGPSHNEWLKKNL